MCSHAIKRVHLLRALYHHKYFPAHDVSLKQWNSDCCFALFQFPKAIHLEMKGFIARSCLDYLQHGVFESDFYWLFDSHDKRYVAYCDFSSEQGAA